MPKINGELIRRMLHEDSEYRGRITSTIKDSISSALALTSFSESERLPKAVSTLGVVVSVYNLGKSLYDLYREHAASSWYFIKINEEESLYALAERWLMEVMPKDEQVSVFARAVWGSENNRRKSINMNTFIDGSIRQELEIDGHRVSIEVSGSEPEAPASGRAKKTSSYRTIQFACPSIEAREAVLAELTTRAEKFIRREPTLARSRNWGGFSGGGYVQQRPVESVILKKGQMDDIVSYLKSFLSYEEEYVKTGLPYHTGVLLHGNPGSGKTSTATAIANELNMDVYYISLSSLDDDDSLYSCMDEVPPRSIVILEDIDVASATKKRDAENDMVTMEGVLNALDGQMTPHGVIFIMTTNHIEKLDPAIIRPGRVDKLVELNELDDYQLRKTCKYFMGFVPENLPIITPQDGITSAQVVGVFKEHIPNYADAEKPLLAFLNKAQRKRKKRDEKAKAKAKLSIVPEEEVA